MMRTQPSARRLISLETAAETASCSPKTIRRMVARGQLTGYRVGQRLLRVDSDELDRVLCPIPTGGIYVG